VIKTATTGGGQLAARDGTRECRVLSPGEAGLVAESHAIDRRVLLPRPRRSGMRTASKRASIRSSTGATDEEAHAMAKMAAQGTFFVAHPPCTSITARAPSPHGRRARSRSHSTRITWQRAAGARAMGGAHRGRHRRGGHGQPERTRASSIPGRADEANAGARAATPVGLHSVGTRA